MYAVFCGKNKKEPCFINFTHFFVLFCCILCIPVLWCTHDFKFLSGYLVCVTVRKSRCLDLDGYFIAWLEDVRTMSIVQIFRKKLLWWPILIFIDRFCMRPCSIHYYLVHYKVQDWCICVISIDDLHYIPMFMDKVHVHVFLSIWWPILIKHILYT